ncbi:MAG: NADH-quinone oxidoreductase subunit N [Mycolicibacterium sp.]|uniref:NADH-quinone oxidoreductase subunit N n=1 Tax=Mycolicibacterium sp. TaxID=2320850 RepID=UPI003D0B88C7
MRPLLLLPEMLLFLGGLGVLIGGSFLPRRRLWITRVAAAAVLVAAIVVAAVLLTGPGGAAFDGTYRVDTATGVVRIVTGFATLLVLALASDEIAGSPRESETYSLALFSTTGTVLLAGADDLLVLAPAFLLASIPLYGLIGLNGGAASAEATMKTYLLGALFGIVLLLGITVVYGMAGSTRYGDFAESLAHSAPAAAATGVLAIVCGLMFKAGGVPAHFWVPDAAQGSSGTVAAFLTTVPKVGALVAVYRLMSALPESLNWPAFIAILAAASMILGNLAAYWQQDPRRLLGWSTVAQVGFLLVPVVAAGRSDLALPSLLFYLAGYVVTNLAAFSVTVAFPTLRDINSYRGMGFTHPWLTAALAVALLGLVGVPPTAVFIGKLTTATAVWDGGYAWLAIVVLVNSLISLFYYLRWIIPTVSRPAVGAVQVPPARWAGRTAVVAAVLSLALGVAAGIVWSVVAAN